MHVPELAVDTTQHVQTLHVGRCCPMLHSLGQGGSIVSATRLWTAISAAATRGASGAATGVVLIGFGHAWAQEPPADFEGVWSMVQHSRPGAPFFIPVEPPLNERGRAVTAAFAAKYDVIGREANGSCVEPGMPTVMWGIGGAAMEVVQQAERITLLSELANQSRRIFLDGRDFPDGFPDQRVGYSIAHWEGETLVIDTRLITEWHAPRWPHSDQMRIVERWSLVDASELELVGLRPGGPRPEITGKVLVNEMTMSDPVFYENDEEVVTVIYRRQEDGVMFEDNCSEYIWMEELERRANAAANP
jgi:hypothetical protein